MTQGRGAAWVAAAFLALGPLAQAAHASVIYSLHAGPTAAGALLLSFVEPVPLGQVPVYAPITGASGADAALVSSAALGGSNTLNSLRDLISFNSVQNPVFIQAVDPLSDLRQPGQYAAAIFIDHLDTGQVDTLVIEATTPVADPGPATVPEPAAAALLMTLLGALALVRHRQAGLRSR